MMTSETNNFTNITTGVTLVVSEPQIWSIEHMVLTSVILGLIILGIIIGNAFVIAAIILEKNLHCVANYLILSLAVADFMVASVVMPISAVNEVTQHWFLGSEVCDMWISMDVLCCTASILSLVAISIDRYWAVTNVNYARTRTAKRILSMVAIIWIVAIFVSVPPIFIFKDENDPAITGVCMTSQDRVYMIISTVGVFYLPTIVLLINYWKIFIVARQRILRKRLSKKHQNLDVQQNNLVNRRFNYTPEVTLLQLKRHDPLDSRLELVGRSGRTSHEMCSSENHVRTKEQIYFTQTSALSTTTNELMKAKQEKEKLKRKRERKAALTLTIVTGTFIVCWLPFFIIAILEPFIHSKVQIPKLVESIALWLGYCNSLLNPIIYTVFNPEFRTAFKHLFYGKCLNRQ